MDDDSWLVDVGFGDAFHESLLIGDGPWQAREHGRAYRVRRVGADDWWMERREAGEQSWEPQYGFTLTPRTLDGAREERDVGEDEVAGVLAREFGVRP